VGPPEDDYERLIRPIEGPMMRAVWRIVSDPHEAEDAFQNALLVVWKRFDRIRRHPNPKALVLRICANEGLNALRRAARRGRGVQPLSDTLAGDSPSGPEALDASERRAQVSAAIARLPRRQALAFLMKAVQEMSYADIATALGCAEATARKHAARARQRLRSLLPQFAPRTC
jgi:RNA polymerase sigma-70 factor (ECF subfamily)